MITSKSQVRELLDHVRYDAVEIEKDRFSDEELKGDGMITVSIRPSNSTMSSNAVQHFVNHDNFAEMRVDEGSVTFHYDLLSSEL